MFTSSLHFTYAAKGVYVSYEMYQRILTMKGRSHHRPNLNNMALFQPTLREELRTRYKTHEESWSGYKQ